MIRRLALVPLACLALAAPARAEEPAWASWTASPVPLDAAAAAALDPLERAALEACGAGDEGLRAAARALLARKLRGLPMPDAEGIAAAQRAAGEPHPWARAFAATARALERDAVVPRLREWLAGEDGAEAGGVRRCGAAAGSAPDGTRALVVVAVRAHADLAPLPTRVRTGQWLTLQARLLEPATGARVVLLGAGGVPRAVPSWLEGSTVRARFAPERPGALTVQVLADLAGGPRPVLEATVLADVDPPSHDEDPAAPGEGVTAGASDADTLAAMVAAARASAGLPPLARDARLDAVAARHAARMAAGHDLAHDAGDGDPAERVRAAGLDARAIGENVAHARTVALAHRALWASPSHRANLVGPFARLGVAVARDEQGDAWVVEELVR